MGINITPIESKQQWHALRRGVVGASEAGALVGVHEYQTYYGLWARKADKISDVEDSPAMERGRRLEPVAIDIIRDRFPHLTLTVPHEHYADRQYGIGCTPDLLATGALGDGVIQIKSVAPSVFRRSWLGDSDGGTPPKWIVIQALMEAELTGSKWAAVAALVVDHGIDLHLIEVPIHKGIIETVKLEALKFWELVLSGREPDPDYMRDSELIRAMLRDKEDGSEVDLSGINDLQDLLDQREAAKGVITGCANELEAIDARLMHMLGEHAVGRFNGGYISAKTIHRKACEVKATSYRQLRVVRAKERSA